MTDDDLWHPDEETLEEYEARTGKNPKKGMLSKKGVEDLANKAGEVHIHVGGDNKDEDEDETEDLRIENEDLRMKMSLLATKAFEVKKKELGVPDWIKSPEALREWQAEQSADPTSRTSSGTLTLRGQNYNPNKKDEWNSVQEMINDLQDIKHSKDKRVSSAQKKEADRILKQLTAKTLSGINKKEDYRQVVEDKDTEPMIQKLNKEFRRRRGIEQDEE